MLSYHRHLGVYGVCYQEDQLIVVHKSRGPYRNRFDLPGGTIESSESMIQAIYREFLEETGFKINVDEGIGTTEFIIPYNINEKTHIQHIAVFLKVSIEESSRQGTTLSDDTVGSEWMNVNDLTISNSSPLVLAAKEYMQTNKLKLISLSYEDWTVKD